MLITIEGLLIDSNYISILHCKKLNFLIVLSTKGFALSTVNILKEKNRYSGTWPINYFCKNNNCDTSLCKKGLYSFISTY